MLGFINLSVVLVSGLRKKILALNKTLILYITFEVYRYSANKKAHDLPEMSSENSTLSKINCGGMQLLDLYILRKLKKFSSQR